MTPSSAATTDRQPRERPVRCMCCPAPTSAHDALCDRCRFVVDARTLRDRLDATYARTPEVPAPRDGGLPWQVVESRRSQRQSVATLARMLERATLSHLAEAP